ncbi:cytokine receptor isoform X2 [Cimex lectularius]|nr:cytokine receptor isoform X2 [Cimex lectularius]
MEVTNYCFLVVFLLHHAVFSLATSENLTCGPGLSTPGYTFPKGDITLEYGSALEIYCILNPDRKENASSLSFTVNGTTIPQSAYKIVNRTTLKLYFKKHPPGRYVYHCLLDSIDDPSSKNRAVCLNVVHVGYKPKEVSNFSCISQNWENMNCTWDPPNNSVPTYYELRFYLKGDRKYSYPCPVHNVVDQNNCVWNASSNPPHRQPYAQYNFVLTAINRLGNLTKRYTVNQYARVLPNKPSNLSLVEATPNSLVISWNEGHPFKSFPPGIVNRLIYQSKWDPQTYWEVRNAVFPPKETSRMYNITGLKYPHTLYDIRVFTRSSVAPDEDFWWSEPATITLRTKPTIPGHPPLTDIGSFETSDSSIETERNVYVYWQQIPRHLENGDKFEYKIIRIEEFTDDGVKIRDITPTEVSKTFAKFTGLSFNRYKFTIVSSNSEGYSTNASYIDVPSKKQSPPEPGSFSKIAFDNGIYELSWNVAPNILSYTIFWCDNKKDRPFDCQGFLNWTKVYVNKDDLQCDENGCGLLQKNITLSGDNVYQFALSANTETSSSGMVWASCTVLPQLAKGKLRNIWISRIGSTFIELSWNLDCFVRSRIIKGFEIIYCPITDPQNSNCKEPSQNMTINGLEIINGAKVTINNLKPYTTYMLYVIAMSENKDDRIKSDALLNTTLEAAPDLVPTNMAIHKITNSSITLSWKPPVSLNGVLRYYQVIYGTDVTRVEDKSEVVYATLNNLRSFENYEIRVSACTVTCSKNSALINAITNVGRPDKMDPPIILNTTKRGIQISWKKPYYPGGYLDFFDVKLRPDRVKDHEEAPFTRLNGSLFSYQWKELECEIYQVQVRAVNVGEDNSTLEGEWSNPTSSNCMFKDKDSIDAWWYILVGVLAVIAISIAFGYFTRCMWLKCKAMQNVGVKLPPQLELNNVYKDNKFPADQPITNHIGTTQLKSLDTNIIPPPDQELLLVKKESEFIENSIEDGEDKNGDRESSGCGSGHDSVSSSITAGTHITDSGTEADERPPSPESPVFSNSPRNRSSDLRQRNISHSNGGEEGFSRLALTPASVPMGYVTVQSAPRGYVSHAPLFLDSPIRK